MEITIGRPYLQNRASGETAICADVKEGGDSFSLWYAVPVEYAHYLCSERSDAFLVALLPWVMIRSSENSQIEVVCEAPVSEHLYHQLTRYYIPVLSSNISFYAPVNIRANVVAEILPSANAVGTGISGGVDSSYTIAQYMNCANQTFRLTHGVYFDMGMYGEMGGASEQAVQLKAKKIADKAALKFLRVTSNSCKVLYKKAYPPIVPSVFMGAILSLQKLFSIYYYSSGVTAADFRLNPNDAAYFDLFNVHCFSTRNTRFYSSGIEASRLEKVKFISDVPFTHDSLTVCLSEDQSRGNCGRCAKCTRTMAQLEVLGKLDRYAESFDVKAFREDPGYHWGYVLLKSRHDPFCREILEKYRAAGHKLPLVVYWACFKKWAARGFTSENRKREKVEKV